MTNRHRHSQFVGTALLCVGLTLNLHIGCGNMGLPAPNLKSRFSDRVVLTPGSALSATLAGTPFEGATALAVDPVTREFELELPGFGLGLNGEYTLVSGESDRDALVACVRRYATRHLARHRSPCDRHGAPPPVSIGFAPLIGTPGRLILN